MQLVETPKNENMYNLTTSCLNACLFSCLGPYDFGGVLTNNNRDAGNMEVIQKRNNSFKEMHWYVKMILISVQAMISFKFLLTS